VVISRELSSIQADEQEMSAGGHMPWRKEPAWVAAVYTADLLGSVCSGCEATGEVDTKGHTTMVLGAQGWKAEYSVAVQTDGHAEVVLQFNGAARYRITLKRPFDYSWYVTSVTYWSGGNGASPVGRPADEMVALRVALAQRGASVQWIGSSRTASVSTARTSARVQVPSRRATVNGQALIMPRAARVVNGRLEVPREFLARFLEADMTNLLAQCRWALSADGLCDARFLAN